MAIVTSDILQDDGPCIEIDKFAPGGVDLHWIINEFVVVHADSGNAIQSEGVDGVVLINNGNIYSSDPDANAIQLLGKNNSITNYGVIGPPGPLLGAVLMGAGSTLVNHGKVYGMVIILDQGGLSLVNTGTMVGGVRSQGDAEDEVHNSGSIVGDVKLGGGGDLYEGGGGLIQGIVKGQRGADLLLGGNDNETFEGGPGKDTLMGGLGDDEIDGGPGKDLLLGGGGADNFIFADRGKADRVLDLSPGDDHILLDNAAWKRLGGEGELEALAFKLGGEATDADDRVLYNANTGALKYDANGDKSGGVTLIARLDPNLSLGHQDFEII